MLSNTLFIISALLNKYIILYGPKYRYFLYREPPTIFYSYVEKFQILVPITVSYRYKVSNRCCVSGIGKPYHLVTELSFWLSTVVGTSPFFFGIRGSGVFDGLD